MSDITLSLIVIAVTALVVVVIFLAVGRAKRLKTEAFDLWALENGCVYTPVDERLASGHRVRGPGWSFEALTTSTGGPEAEGSSNVSSNTYWQSDRSALPAGLLLIGERVAHPALGPLADSLLPPMLKTLLGDKAADVQGLREVSAGSPAFQQLYMVWATDPADAERVLTPRVVSQLMAWPLIPPPLVRLSPRGCRIDIRNRRIEDVKDLERLITLGKVLMEAVS